jgi:hypothetical protein
VAVGENVGLDIDYISNNPLDGKLAAIHLWL